MSKTSAKAPSVIHRCAVCKIDLKGRFAFIDDEFLELTGYSCEELLGRPVGPFFDPSSRELVNKLINERSHYETVYDSAPLTLLNKKQESVDVSATMFLNFSGGNPVNFQLILSSHPIPQRIKQIDIPVQALDQTYIDFVKDLTEIESDKDWQKIVNTVLAFSSAGQAALYRFEKDSLVTLATRIDDSQAEFTGTQISKTTELHLKVAQTESEYNFTDESSVRRAVENVKSAPNEFITTFKSGTKNFLIRFVYESKMDPESATDMIDRAKTATKIISKFFCAGTVDSNKPLN